MASGHATGTADLQSFLAARDFLLLHREDYATAKRDFRWPQLTTFNWALDYFDGYARENPSKTALWIVEEDGNEQKYSYNEMSRRSNQVANFLQRHGVRRGDRIVVMLPNVVAIWEVMLATLKMGAVVIPAATLLTTADLEDRFQRGKARHVIATAAAIEKFGAVKEEFVGIVAGADVPGWTRYEDAYNDSADLHVEGASRATDPFLLYFTSG